MSWRSVLGTLVVCAFLPLATFQPVAAQDFDTFASTIQQAADHLRGAEPDAGAALALLEGVEPVTIEGGGTISPDLTLILDDLRMSPPNVERALTRIDVLIVVLDRVARSPATGDDALDALDSVLARGEFAVDEPNERSPTLRERLSNWLGKRITAIAEWLDDWLSPLTGKGEDTSAAGAVMRAFLAATGIAAVIVVIVLVVRNVRASMTSDIARLEAERELRLTAADARADAERLFQAGNYREALRATYLATLLRLDEAGRLRFDRSLTNQEVLRVTQLHGDQVLRQRLAPLVEWFDRVWYGNAPCSANDYETFSQLADQVWEIRP